MFRTIFTTLRALLKSGLCATQLCIRSDTASYALLLLLWTIVIHEFPIQGAWVPCLSHWDATSNSYLAGTTQFEGKLVIIHQVLYFSIFNFFGIYTFFVVFERPRIVSEVQTKPKHQQVACIYSFIWLNNTASEFWWKHFFRKQGWYSCWSLQGVCWILG